MAKLIILTLALVACLGLLLEVDSETSMGAKEWNEWYDELMDGKVERKDRVVVELIMLSLMKLHKDTTEPVDEIKKALVAFWFDSVLDKPEHCSLQYMNRLKARCEEFIETQRSAMIKFCRHRSETIPDECLNQFGAAIVKQPSLSKVDRENLLDFAKAIDIEGTKSSAGVKIARIVGLQALDKFDKFKAAWLNGPCKKVLSTYEDFKKTYTEMDSFIEDSSIVPSGKANVWMSVLRVCRRYQNEDELRAIYRYAQI